MSASEEPRRCAYKYIKNKLNPFFGYMKADISREIGEISVYPGLIGKSPNRYRFAPAIPSKGISQILRGALSSQEVHKHDSDTISAA